MPVWLSVLGVAVVFVGFLGAAVVYLRGSKDKGTIDVLERSNHALTERVTILEKDNGEMKARLGHLERENIDLRAQRPSAEVLAEVRIELLNLAASERTHSGEARALLMAIATTLGEMNDADQ